MANFLTFGQGSGGIPGGSNNAALVQTTRDLLTALRQVQTLRVRIAGALNQMTTAKEVTDALGVVAVKDADGHEVLDAADSDNPKTADHQAAKLKAEILSCSGNIDGAASDAINQLLAETGY